MSALVALTAQNTTAVTAIHELPPEFVVAQLEAVFSDLGVDAAKTGMLFSEPVIDAVADFLDGRRVPLRPTIASASGRFGVTTVASGKSRRTSATAASGGRRRAHSSATARAASSQRAWSASAPVLRS